MKHTQIAFFDIDGTLVDPATGSISPLTRQALAALKGKGIRLFVATGRPPASLPSMEDLPFEGFLTTNGALCYTKSEIIFSSPISRESVDKLIQNAAAIGRPVSLALADRLIANGYDRDLADYYGLCGLQLTVEENFDTLCRKDVYQVMLGCREEDHPAIVRGVEGVKIAISWDRAVDVIPTFGGKGAAIQKTLEHYHLTPDQAIAFGDSYNDIDMLQAVGTGVAMGNAADALKTVADHICAPVSQDGIYHFCRETGLI